MTLSLGYTFIAWKLTFLPSVIFLYSDKFDVTFSISKNEVFEVELYNWIET